MTYTQSLVETLSEKHLLKHPFYQAWNNGTLCIEDLQTYAKQYYHHVKAFPRYLSATHSHCPDIQQRQVLLENLIDEESGDENHPELWVRFAEGLGVSREELEATPAAPEIKNVIDTFFKQARDSFESGLGALFAYEHQIPEIAEFKSDALKKQFHFTDPRMLSFFDVHKKADVYHT